MKMIKSIHFLILLSLLVLPFVFSSASAYEISDNIIFYTQDLPPYSMIVESKPDGAGVDIVKAVCGEMKSPYEINFTSWSRAQQYLKTGKADSIFIVGRTEERENWMYFSKPVFSSHYGFFVRNNSPLNFPGAKDMKGKIIGVYGPSFVATTLQKQLENYTGVFIDMSPDDEEAFKKLSFGRIDAVFSNHEVGIEMIKRAGYSNIMYEKNILPVIYYFGFSQNKRGLEIRNRFDKAFTTLYKTGEITKILKKYGIHPASI